MIVSRKKFTASLWVSASLALSLGVFNPGQAFAATDSSISTLAASTGQTGIIEASVRLRTDPSNSSTILKYLNKGDQVVILEAAGSYWYKVRTAEGIVGYTSSGGFLYPGGYGFRTCLTGCSDPIHGPCPGYPWNKRSSGWISLQE
ncbi:SH3 domain-containing protein [Paenibacillus rhizoplanae]